MNYIYALICPLSNQIRYVGKTVSIKTRYSAHLNDNSKSHKSSWIKSLKTKGLKPNYIILDTVEKDTSFWEQYWIAQCKAWGFDLVNHTLGGEAGCTGIYNPRGNAKLSKKEVIEIYNSNKTVEDICNQYSISISTVRGIKNGSIWNLYTGHNKENNNKKISKLSEETKEKVKELYNTNNYSIYQIESLFLDKHKRGTIRSYLKKYVIIK